VAGPLELPPDAVLARDVHGSGKVGPSRVDGTAVQGGDSVAGARLTLHDEGNGDKAVTAASALFQIVG
jgi:hypothetical protein